MKKRKTYWLRIMMSITLVMLMLTSCTLFSMLTGENNGGEETDPGNTNPTATPVIIEPVTISGSIVDGKTEGLITQTVTLTFNGESKDTASTAAGAVHGKLNISDGRISFNVPGEALSGLDFTLVASAEGYIGNSVRIYNIAADYSFTIKLTKISDAPTGVSVKQQSIGSVDALTGTVTSEVTIATDTSAETAETAEITIPAGTKMLDSSGESLSGELTATVGYFSPKEEDALRSFPGGFDVSVTDPSSNTSDDGFFVTGGFVSIDIIDESGKIAETFDGGSLGVNVDIPSDLINPETGEPVKEGDIIPLWSYNPETGEWTKEAEVTRSGGRVKTENSKLKMSFNVPHLSYWNIDWFNPGKLDESRPIVFTGDGMSAGEYFVLRLYSPTRGFLTEKSMYYDGEELILQNVPSFPLTITILDNSGTVLGEVENAQLGEEGNLEIAITAVEPTATPTPDVNVTPTAVVTPVVGITPSVSPVDLTGDIDFSTLDYQISFTVNGESHTLDTFLYPIENFYNGDVQVSQYIKQYYDTLKGDYTGPYCKILNYEGSFSMLGGAQLTDSTGTYYVQIWLAPIGVYLYLYELDLSGNIIAGAYTYTQASVPFGTVYNNGDDFTTFIPGPIDGFTAMKTPTRRYNATEVELTTAEKLSRAIANSDYPRMEEFGKMLKDELAHDLSSKSRNSIPATFSNVIVKAKIIQLKDTTNQSDIWIRSPYSYIDAKVRQNFPVEIEFDLEDFDTPTRMDTSITDLYINDVLVQGTWKERQDYDVMVDVLTYVPPSNWDANSSVMIDLPEYHKTLSGVTLYEPKTLLYKIGSGTLSEPYDFNVEAYDLFEIEVNWCYEKNIDTVRFEIYRSESETGPFTMICDTQYQSDIPGTKPCYSYYPEDGYAYFEDETVVGGTTYYYKIRTIDTVTNNFFDSEVQSATAILTVPLGLDTWTEGSFGSEIDDDTIWYEVDVAIDTSYSVSVDHLLEGSGAYDADVEVCGYYHSEGYLYDYFWYATTLYTIPVVVKSVSDKLYIKVARIGWSLETKTYAIKVSEIPYVAPPSNLTSVNGTGSIDLTWEDTADCDLFYVYRQTRFSNDYMFLGIAETAAYSDSQIEAGLVYDYRVVGKKGAGISEPTELVTNIYFEGLTIPSINADGNAYDFSSTKDYNETGEALMHSFSTEAGKSYLITYNDGEGTYIGNTHMYIFDSQGRFVPNLSSSSPLVADGNMYYSAFIYHDPGDAFSIRITEVTQ